MSRYAELLTLAVLVTACGRHEAHVPAAIAAAAPASVDDTAPPIACPTDADPICAACAANDGQACLALALDTERGERHVSITERGCQLQYAPACEHLGLLLLLPTTRSAHRIALVDRACERGDAPTCVIIGHRYAEADAPRALTYFERACELSPASSCLPLYRMLSGVEDDQFPASPSPEVINHQRARAVLESACTSSDVEACLLRGDLDHRFGDDGAAARWDDAACARSAHGCTLAADAYADGGRRPKSPKHASVLYTSGCERGDAAACEALAVIIEDGIGLRRDVRRARQLHERACQLDARSPGCNAR